MPILNMRRETQIVAFLLLFFLAHSALSEDCKPAVQADVRYSCDLLNVSKGSVVHWDNWTNGVESCADTTGVERLFTRETTAIIRSDYTFEASANESTLAGILSQSSPNSLVAGLRVERKSKMTAGAFQGVGGYDLEVKAFIAKATEDDTIGVTTAKPLSSKSVVSIADGTVRTIGAEYEDAATQTTLHLHCAFKVK